MGILWSLALVTSLNRPGGNITGATFIGQQLAAKRLELLHEIMPRAKTIALLVNPTGPQTESQIKEAESAATNHSGSDCRLSM